MILVNFAKNLPTNFTLSFAFDTAQDYHNNEQPSFQANYQFCPVSVLNSMAVCRGIVVFTEAVLLRALLSLIPGSYYYARRNFEIKKICEWAGDRGFTNLIILGQGLQLGGNKKFPCSMLLVHLPEGPTLHFRISSVKLPDEIQNHARVTKHKPELILNNFTTRLGLRVSRALAALFPQVDAFSSSWTYNLFSADDDLKFASKSCLISNYDGI